MKLIVCLLIVLACGTSHASAISDPDKQVHFAVSTGLTIGTYGLLRHNNYGRFESALAAATLTMFLGLAKEISDKELQIGDLEANAVGAGVGMLISLPF